MQTLGDARRQVELATFDEGTAVVDFDFRIVLAVADDQPGSELESFMSAGHRGRVITLAAAGAEIVALNDAVAGPIDAGDDTCRRRFVRANRRSRKRHRAEREPGQFHVRDFRWPLARSTGHAGGCGEGRDTQRRQR